MRQPQNVSVTYAARKIKGLHAHRASVLHGWSAIINAAHIWLSLFGGRLLASIFNRLKIRRPATSCRSVQILPSPDGLGQHLVLFCDYCLDKEKSPPRYMSNIGLYRHSYIFDCPIVNYFALFKCEVALSDASDGPTLEQLGYFATGCRDGGSPKRYRVRTLTALENTRLER